MAHYWLMTCLFNFAISILTYLGFCIYAYFNLHSSLFTQTNWLVLVLVLVGWILCQIGMATFFQVFLSNSRAANIIGYLITIWTNLIGATFNIALYRYPMPLPTGFALWPTFSFNRLFYLMLIRCSDDHCYSTWESLDS